MPCGPLQTMQLYALGTGSFLTGALSMFFFSLGTIPLLFGLGIVSALVSHRFNRRMLAATGILVLLLGVVMITRGLSLTGTSVSTFSSLNYHNIAVMENDRQVVQIQLEPYYYKPVVVQQGIPVLMIISAEEKNINGCNNAIVIPAFDLRYDLTDGENYVGFTPTETGNIAYSCWMGMIRSTIHVVEDLSQISPVFPEVEPDPAGVDPETDCCTISKALYPFARQHPARDT